MPTVTEIPVFPAPGFQYDMPAATYHAIQACSASALKQLVKSPRHLHQWLTTRIIPSPAMILGTATHTATLEPAKLETSLLVAGECGATTGKGALCGNNGKYLSGGEWYCGTHIRGRTQDALPELLDEDENLVTSPIISQEDFYKAQAMARAIRSHRECAGLLSSPTARVEVSVFWYETVTLRIDEENVTVSIPCKARMDVYDYAYREWGTVISDIKSCQCSHVSEFEDDVAERRYDVQAAWYCRGATVAGGGLEHKWFMFLPIESTPTHLPSCLRLRPEELAYGHDQIFGSGELLAAYAYCMKTNRWDGYPGHHRILVCGLPKWHHAKEERELRRDNRLGM